MKLALRLALVSGALVLGGAGAAAARAWALAPGLALGYAAAGVALAAALVALLHSDRAEDHDPLSALLVAGAALALGVGLERAIPSALPPGAVQGAPVLLAALVVCARIGLRRKDFSSLDTPDLVRAAARSARAREAALELLPGRPDALDAVIAVSTTDPTSSARLAAAELLGAVAPSAAPPARARAVAAAVRALEAAGSDDAARTVGVRLALALAHPDLLPALRRLSAGARDRWALLEARAACGDLDVLDDLLAPDLLAADDADRARDLVRRLGGAALPALAARLGRAGPDDAARLLALVGALPRSDEAFEMAAARAGADQPVAVRAAALRALHDLDPARAVPHARAALDAPDVMVRTWAESILRAAEMQST